MHNSTCSMLLCRHHTITSFLYIFCIYTIVYTTSKDIGINKEKEICLPYRESISGHRCERTAMAAKCEMLMNCIKNFIVFIGNKYNCQTRNI